MTAPRRLDDSPPVSSSGTSGRRHLHALTGLRLVAALAVYVSHLGAPAASPPWLLALQQSGYAGVTFFFVLSGFVLTINYYDDLRTPQQLWSYAVARVARVFPLYLAVLSWPAVAMWTAGELPKKLLLLHVLGLQAWSPDINTAYALVGPAWSISIELFLYATLPLLVAVVRLLDRRLWVLVAATLLVLAAVAAVAYLFHHSDRAALPFTDPGSSHRWLYRSPVGRIGDFLVGVLAARVYRRLTGTPAGTLTGWWLIGPAVVVTLAVAASPSLVATTFSWDALYAPPAAALILGLALAPRHPLSQLLSLRVVVFLGEASFAFYLVHRMILEMTGAGAWESDTLPHRLAVEVLDLGLAIALAVGLHVGIERPARVFVKRLLDRAGRSGRTSPPERSATVAGDPVGPLTTPIGALSVDVPPTHRSPLVRL